MNADMDFPGALRSFGALIFLTLLWVTTTLLEAVEVDCWYSRLEPESEGKVLFGMIFVENALNGFLLGSWIGQSPGLSSI